MAFAKKREKKDGTVFYEIRAYHKDKKTHYSKYYYPPFGWSARSINKALSDEIADFQRAVDAGEVLSKKEKQAVQAAEAAEAALLKTVRQYADSVFMTTKEQSIAENTRLSYRTNLDQHILPVLGDTLMKDVTPAMLSSLLLKFQKGHSHGSAIKVYNILAGIFKMAYKDDTIERNPMDKVDRPKQRKDDKAVSEADKALSGEELNTVLECVSKEPLKWQAFINLAADTGARRGELCGIQWSDIDLRNGLVHIKRNLQYSKGKGIYECTPKGGKFRSVDIGEDTADLLRKWAAEQSGVRMSKWVFTVDGDDSPMFPSSPTRYFKKFGDKYGIPGFHPHLLRHTSATLSLNNGADVKSVADRLGHGDASVTLRIYAHANDESIRKAGQAARDALKRKKEQGNKENAGA